MPLRSYRIVSFAVIILMLSMQSVYAAPVSQATSYLHFASWAGPFSAANQLNNVTVGTKVVSAGDSGSSTAVHLRFDAPDHSGVKIDPYAVGLLYQTISASHDE